MIEQQLVLVTLIQLIFAMIADQLLHERYKPKPHPVVLMGKLINFIDKSMNKGPNRKIKGIFAVIIFTIISLLSAEVISILPFKEVITALVLWILLAQRSLIDHAKTIIQDLSQGEIAKARLSLSAIVGRNTRCMDKSNISKATIESTAEGFLDGFMSPVFWFLILGLDGIIVYKMINTADSMIGNKSTKHVDFGWAAARLDDLLNFIPARITAVIIAVASGKFKCSMRTVLSDAKWQRSPNAGWPMSAIAGALNIKLSGEKTYGNKTFNDSNINPYGNSNLNTSHINKTIETIQISWFIILTLCMSSIIFIYSTLYL